MLDADDRPDLAELALLVSAHARPDEVDVEHELVAVDLLAADLPPAGDLDELLTLLFDHHGFRGDVDDYYAVDNSRIEVVVRRRVGIPLTLAIVTCSVGARAGLVLHPVGLPGHVIVAAGGGERFIDVFDRGRNLSRDDCARIVQTLHPETSFSPAMLAPMAPRAVVVRMLNNLIAAHQRRGTRAELLDAISLRDAVHTGVGDAVREVAAALASTGRLAEAADRLEDAAERAEGPEAMRLLAAATRYRAKLN